MLATTGDSFDASGHLAYKSTSHTHEHRQTTVPLELGRSNSYMSCKTPHHNSCKDKKDKTASCTGHMAREMLVSTCCLHMCKLGLCSNNKNLIITYQYCMLAWQLLNTFCFTMQAL